MTILTMNRKELEKRVGKIDAKLEKMITDMGTPGDFGSQVLGIRSLSLVGVRFELRQRGCQFLRLGQLDGGFRI
ncbi:hypothetical protein J4226_05475 [Candidatus Pacearchaeota archaeon]|nr:hypothetical protein [Candidatus Pacearchaeota archaeon]